MVQLAKLQNQPLVIASHNAGKIREIEALLAPLDIRVASAADYGVPAPEETGATFRENARLKSHFCAKHTGLPSLSDDSGLAIDALDGAPGIYSARWAGANNDFAAAMEKIHRELHARSIPNHAWQAQFVCVLSLCNARGESVEFEGRVLGHLTFPPCGSNGFGYDPIFIPEGETRSFGEMPADEKHAISHRADAFGQLMAYLKESEKALQ